MFRRLLLSVCFILMLLPVVAQRTVVLQPVVLEKSHRTIRVDSVITTASKTTFYLRILNERNRGGWFCLSDEIELYSNQTYLSKASTIKGIPICPESHRFTSVGEEVAFQVVFPPIPEGTQVLTIQEVCDEACMGLKGIVLDKRFNRKALLFDKALGCYQQGDYLRCIKGFERVLAPPLPLKETTSLYAFAYYYIISGYLRSGQREEGLVWYYRLQSSELDDKVMIMRRLQEEYQLPDE